MRMRIPMLLAVHPLIVCNPPSAAVQQARFVSGDRYLIVEALDDDLIHFELSTHGPVPMTRRHCTPRP